MNDETWCPAKNVDSNREPLRRYIYYIYSEMYSLTLSGLGGNSATLTYDRLSIINYTN